MKALSKTPAGSNAGNKSKTIRDIKIPYTKPDFSTADIINTISDLLIAEYAVEQKAHIKKARRGRTITPCLSHNLKIGIYDVAKDIIKVCSWSDNRLHRQTNVRIEYTSNERVDVTIYLTGVNSTTIYNRQLSGDILLISKDSQQVTYLENDLSPLNYNNIQSALRSIIEEMFSKHQQAYVEIYAKKYRLTNPTSLMDIDFSYELFSPAIAIEDHMKPTSNDRIRVQIDYFRETWTHIRVHITLFDSKGDREAVKISGDMLIWDYEE